MSNDMNDKYENPNSGKRLGNAGAKLRAVHKAGTNSSDVGNDANARTESFTRNSAHAGSESAARRHAPQGVKPDAPDAGKADTYKRDESVSGSAASARSGGSTGKTATRESRASSGTSVNRSSAAKTGGDTPKEGLKPSLRRMVLLSAILLGVMVVMFVRMYTMIVGDADRYTARATNQSTRTITTYGKRGTIYDTNMVPLAYDTTSWNVTFYRDPTRSEDADRAAYTQVLIKVIGLVESNGKSTVNDFWLKKDEEGVWRFDSGSGSESVESSRESQWRTNFYLTNVPEEELWDTLLQKYFIPEELSEDMKVKVLALWQESRMNAFNSMPVPIAYDVGFETVSEIEAMSLELDGIDIEESSSRVYPQGRTAAHLTGYISKISASQLETYRSQGYPVDAYIGAAGVEYSLEDQLSPYISYRQGKREVEINTRGKVVRELDYQTPTDGNSVVLTIDVDLEKVMREALIDTIAEIREAQETQIRREYWQDVNEDVLKKYEENDWKIDLAESGAMVCMDPHSGKVLGMVSYPDYDLSMFNGGKVNSAMWNELLEENDPLYNRAISTRDSPGSIFKLVTALGGLAEGVLTPTRTISDRGSFTKTNATNPAKCWISADQISEHQNLNVTTALSHSCNYFFYETSYELGVTKLYQWAAALGLTSKTNVELPGESISIVGNQNMLYDPDKSIYEQETSKPMLADRSIRELIAQIEAERNVDFSDELVDESVAKLMRIAVSYETKSEWNRPIRDVLQYDLGLPAQYIETHYFGNTIVTYLQDIFWTPNETIMDGIGQSVTQVTPVAVARYVAAICNGGTVYDAQIVDKIIGADGRIVLEKEPVIANQIQTDPNYYTLIMRGMEDVTSAEDGGTAGSYFRDWKYTDVIAAKTGTSQRTELDVENNAWMVAYAPRENPQIVVVCYIQNGYAGARCSTAIKAVIEHWLDAQQNTETTAVTQEFSFAD